MKRRFVLILVGLSSLFTVAVAQELDFQNPPQSSRPYLWWHWIDGNISKDGIKKDLEWMNRVGIGGFHQFDAGGAMMQGVSPIVDPKPYLSDTWKDAFSYAIHLADSLGMEIGIASAPGWSSTGGPWVEPADGMKKLTWRSIEISGGCKQTISLPEPYRNVGKFLNCDGGLYAPMFASIFPWYDDIAIVAVRIPDEEKSMAELDAGISSSGGIFTIEQLTNGDINDGAELPVNKEGTHSWLQYDFPQNVTIRSFTLVGGQVQGQFDQMRSYANILFSSLDGQTWEEVCRIPSSALPQITVDIPETTAKHFRLMVMNPVPDYSLAAYGVPVVMPTGTKIHEFKLHTVFKVNHAEEKAGFSSPGDLSLCPTYATSFPVKDVIDLTDMVREDGILDWDVPAGKWRIYRFGASLTGKQNHPAPAEATGLEVDKLDKDAWIRYFTKYLDLYKDAAGDLMGSRGIQYILVDSYEAEHMTWTPDMVEAFRQARGYDLISWLPALAGEIIGSTEDTEAFLFDWRKTIGELFTKNYDRINDIVKRYGMMGRYTESHEAGRAYVGDGMDIKRTATVPMSAIWTGNLDQTTQYQADIRESASVSHIYGQNIVAGEAFTSNGMFGNAYGWYPGNLKEVADVALLSGLNRFFIHDSAHQPSDEHRPGMGLLIYGQWFNRHETWAEYAKYWTDYLARSCYMLQKGKSVADILWYYGEDTNIVSEYGANLPEVPQGYAYDFASPDVLLNCINVKGGIATTDSGQNYRVLVLGKNTQIMSVSILRKLYELVNGGIFLIGNEPITPAGYGDDPDEFARLVADIWHTTRSNVWIGSVPEGLVVAGLQPDFISSSASVRYFHRNDGERNIYWVRNFSDEAVDTELTLRNANGFWSIFDPETGNNGALKGHELHLDPNQALFIVVDPSSESITDNSELFSDGTINFNGKWNVSFDSLPYVNVELDGLKSWTDFAEPDIKYYSGTATYTNTFSLKKKEMPEAISINLGEVGQMADIFINGEHVAFVWKYPYKVRYDGKLKVGKNIIEVKVVNLWVNRLIGDAQKDVLKQTYTTYPFYQDNSELIPSGLIGPFTIEKLNVNNQSIKKTNRYYGVKN